MSISKWLNRKDTHTHTLIYTPWNFTHPYKEWNKTICGNRDGSRDYHTKWSKSEKNIIYYLYVKCREKKQHLPENWRDAEGEVSRTRFEQREAGKPAEGAGIRTELQQRSNWSNLATRRAKTWRMPGMGDRTGDQTRKWSVLQPAGGKQERLHLEACHPS